VVLPPEWTRGGETFLLRVRGDSMRDAHIVPGDLVIVQKQSTARDGDIVVALVKEEEATLKRFSRRNGRIVLRPENPALEPMEFEAGDVQIVGVVKGLVRML
jgi:repressor LexA